MSETTSYLEIELKGPGDQAVGYVEGFRLGTGDAAPVWYAGREEVDIPGFWDRLRQKLHMETHVIVPEPLGRALMTALERTELLELQVGEVHEVDYAELAFTFEVYNREEGRAVRRVIEEDLPEEVRLEGYETAEEIHEDAKGPELYTPVHHYVLTGRGRYVGPVPGILAMAHRLSGQSFIHPEKVRLHRVS